MPTHDRTIPERLATLEAVTPELKADVAEIKADVKTLLAAHNRQQGFVMLGRLLWGGACAGLALAGEWLVQHWGHP